MNKQTNKKPGWGWQVVESQASIHFKPQYQYEQNVLKCSKLSEENNAEFSIFIILYLPYMTRFTYWGVDAPFGLAELKI